MIIVGNIVSNEEITGLPTNFNVLTMEDYLMAKTNFDKASILRKKISDGLYWTFSTSEKRKIFEEDLKKFIKRSHDDLVKGIKHFNIDPINYKINTTEELIEKMKSLAGGFAYLYSDKVVYVYHNFNLFSIDLDQLDFIGFDRGKVLSKLEEDTIFVKNEDKNFKNELKYLNIKYIPYLMFKDATKSTTSSLIC
jgi:hypothetical protein